MKMAAGRVCGFESAHELTIGMIGDPEATNRASGQFQEKTGCGEFLTWSRRTQAVSAT